MVVSEHVGSCHELKHFQQQLQRGSDTCLLRFPEIPWGAVMGADPATSAVNKYLQSWDVPNVFTVGGSAFPQNSASAPTCTIGALACWAADSIKDRYRKRPDALA